MTWMQGSGVVMQDHGRLLEIERYHSREGLASSWADLLPCIFELY